MLRGAPHLEHLEVATFRTERMSSEPNEGVTLSALESAVVPPPSSPHWHINFTAPNWN